MLITSALAAIVFAYPLLILVNIGIFWIALYGLTVLAMIIGGYDAGLAGGRRSATTLLSVSLAFSMVLILVVSLDRPQIELAKVNQAALLDLQRTMQRSMRTQQ